VIVAVTQCCVRTGFVAVAGETATFAGGPGL
jgi:hypothetical protein